MQIQIDASAFDNLEQAWERAPEIVREEMLTAVVVSDVLIGREVKERTPTGAGSGAGLRGSIGATEEGLADNVIGMVGTSLAYAVPVELGTRPHFPPVAPILDWVKARLDVPENQQVSVAHAIVRKIGKVGTKGAHMFERGFDATASQVERYMALGVERVRDRLAES